MTLFHVSKFFLLLLNLKRKRMKGVIFDFNGTLFWDTAYHNNAWDIFLAKNNKKLSDSEKDVFIHGKNSKAIFEFLFERELTPVEVGTYTEEKEQIYREICLSKGMELAPGAIDFIEFLIGRNIVFTIATASGWENVQFFVDQFKLNRWFNIEKIVYDNGKIQGKPSPDIFLAAARNLELPIHECVIFEDSISGLKAAQNANPGKIYHVNSINMDSSEVSQTSITNFNQVDIQLF